MGTAWVLLNGLQIPSADHSLVPRHRGDGAHRSDGLLPGRSVLGCTKHPGLPPSLLLEAELLAPEERDISDLERIPSLSQGVHVELETACFLSGLYVQLFKQIVFSQLIIDEENSCISCTMLFI